MVERGRSGVLGRGGDEGREGKRRAPSLPLQAQNPDRLSPFQAHSLVAPCSEIAGADWMLSFCSTGYIWYDWANKKYDVRSPFPLYSPFTSFKARPSPRAQSFPSPPLLALALLLFPNQLLTFPLPSCLVENSGTTRRRDTIRPISRRLPLSTLLLLLRPLRPRSSFCLEGDFGLGL